MEAQRQLDLKRNELNNVNFNDKGQFRKSLRKFKKGQKDNIYEITKKLAATHASIQENEVKVFGSRKTVFHN